MNHSSTLEQRIARAQEAIAKWPEGKIGTMQLQGADVFRMKSTVSISASADEDETQIRERRSGNGALIFG